MPCSCTVGFLFHCVGCSTEELTIIEAYEARQDVLPDATPEQKAAIMKQGDFDHFTLFEDYHVSVKQFYYDNQLLLCVEWSAIHFFYFVF